MSLSCIFCHDSSIERKVRLSDKQRIFFESSPTGLTCTSCSRFICSDFIRDIFKRIPQSSKEKDSLCQVVNQFLTTGGKHTFLGSCCELKDIKKTPLIISSMTPLSYDGYLFRPEYRLLIDSSIGNEEPIDIHGQAKHDTLFPGVVHCVLSRASCALASSSKVQAKGEC